MNAGSDPGTDWVAAWVDQLEELSTLRRAYPQALALIEDLLADPFVRLGPTTQRLSEWEDFWWDHIAPIVTAIGIDPARVRKPWDRIAKQVEEEREAQALLARIGREPPASETSSNELPYLG